MFRLIHLTQVPILEQLRIEEALLRASDENWCLLNTDASPAIVMGISGIPEKLLDRNRVSKDNIPVIKRFSGGGTVYVDRHTVFATLICNRSTLNIPLQPQPILQWSETFYRSFFNVLSLRENDYVMGDKKFGGNAQYIQKNRWLLHTSFLWDYSPEKMRYLLLPEKRPQYRKDRSHADFLCALRPLYPDKSHLMNSLASYFEQTLSAQPASLKDIQEILNRPHRTSTTMLT
jgi:lipoate-protein ligase A